MYCRISLVALGMLFIGCDNAGGPVAPTTVTQDVVANASGVRFNGRSVGVEASLREENSTICDTGRLPQDGGQLNKSEQNATIEDAFSAANVSCITTGLTRSNGEHRASGESTVAKLVLRVGGNTITADRVHAMVAAACPADGPTRNNGHLTFTNLVVNGRSIAVPLNARNRRIDLPNGFLVIGQQRDWAIRGSAGHSIDGLRVVIEQPEQAADVKLARVHVHVECPT